MRDSCGSPAAASASPSSSTRNSAPAPARPPPLDNSRKCARCSLLPICLPDEVNLFRSGGAPRTPPPAADSALPLYVQQPGARVGKKGDLLVISIENEPDREVPVGEVSELVLAGPVSLSTPALHALVKEEIPIAWMSSGFWFIATTGARGPRSAHAREGQYAARADAFRRLLFARDLVRAKLRNQRTIMRRNWRGNEAEREHATETLKRLADRATKAAGLPELLGVEGEGAAVYFRALPALFTDRVATLPAFSFERRSRRPPADPVNACLSLCYALLTRTCATALEIAGLDPWAGLYHADRPGRPALALDFMEPLRPILADSTVLTALNNGELAPADFITAGPGCNLTAGGRRTLIRAFERRLDQEASHPTFGYQISMRRMLHVQARLFARHLLGEIDSYPHYCPR